MLRPPLVPGVPEPRARDAFRIVWWQWIGLRHGARRGRSWERTYSAVLAVGWWLSWPLTMVVQTYLLRRRTARYYMSPTRDAVLAIVATRKGWHIEDHATARPGTGSGRALRALVFPDLLAAADATGVAVYTTAATARLAVEYAAELPGLVDAGRGYPRGRKMRRDPSRLPSPVER
ncbi:MAG: hypothetical protein ACRCY9_17220 [Phycicoccus sp.]